MSTPRRPSPAPEGAPIPTVDEVFGEVPPPRATPASQAGVVALSAVSLAAAAGALYAGEAPQCGESRADEATAHTPAVSSSLRRGELVAAVREVAIAMGIVRHPTTRGVDNEMHTAGVAMPVEPTRPQPPSTEPDVRPDGGVAEVQPTPPQLTPDERPIQAPGRVSVVNTHRERPAPRPPRARHGL